MADDTGTGKVSLTVLLFEQAGHWVAQALEKDFAAQGTSLIDAVEGLVASVVAQVRADRRANREPLAATPRAPQRFFRLAERTWVLEPPDTFDLDDNVDEWRRLEPHFRMVVGQGAEGAST